MAQTKAATTKKSSTPVAKPATKPEPAAPAQKDEGVLTNAANWLLSRLPWFKHRYLGWSKGKRILIGFLMYLIVLPVIPIVIAIVMYVRDPEGFKNSKAMYILGGVILAWLGGFGLIAAQPPQTGVNSADATSISKEAKDAIKDRKDSAQTLGRQFENCDAAFKVGVFNIAKTDPSYAATLDRDNDGVACEKN